MIVDDLKSEMNDMLVIDTHEHIPSETELIKNQADIFTRIYGHYVAMSLVSAGANIKQFELKDTTIPLDERWAKVKPYLNAISNTGFLRTANITAKDLYDIDRIDDDTYQLLSDRLQQQNTPGLYKRIIKDKCNIETMLTLGHWSHADQDFIKCVYNIFWNLWELGADDFREFYQQWKQSANTDFTDPEQLTDYILQTLKDVGCVAIKFIANTTNTPIDESTAKSLFKKFKTSSITDEESTQLGTYLTHRLFAKAYKYSLVVTFHCGMGSSIYEDPTLFDVDNLIPIFDRYRETKFDLYHCNMPHVRQMAPIALKYPNVHLNLTWSYQQSPFIVERMLNEWMDLVPSNKIIAFGGDYSSPENVYGVLKLTKQTIARALAERIKRGLLTESDAIETCRQWLYENPKKLYGLE